MLPGGPTRFRCAHRLTPFPQPGRATGIIPAVRLAEEAPRLRPLRVRPEELALRIPVYVGPYRDGAVRRACLLDASRDCLSFLP